MDAFMSGRIIGIIKVSQELHDQESNIDHFPKTPEYFAWAQEQWGYVGA